MSKSIELTPTQIKAKKAVATMFLFPIDINKISINLNEENGLYFNSAYKFECSYCKGKDSQCTDCYGKGYICDLDCESKEEFIAKYSPVQKGDKDIFVKNTQYSFKECIDVRVVRVQEINIKDIPKIQTEMWMFDDWYNQQMKEQNINRTYEDNDYVFLIEFT